MPFPSPFLNYFSSMPSLSHLDAQGKASMVGVGHKPDQKRIAEAIGTLQVKPETIRLLKKKALPKGDVLTVAQIAGIQAAKKTADLIPLCHPLPLHKIDLQFKIGPKSIEIWAMAETTGKTGVEMEALTAVSVAALTLFDMCKAVDKTMKITNIRVLKKTKRDLTAKLDSKNAKVIKFYSNH